MCSILKCINETFSNLCCNFKKNQNNRNMEIPNQNIEYQTGDIEDSWYCSQGNQHPISQKFCRCYWEKISKEV